jgi:hypothetical protein
MVKKSKNSAQPTTTQELVLMRMNIQAMKERLCQDLDAMASRLDRLLPSEDPMRYQKFKNYTPKDWRNYLKS